MNKAISVLAIVYLFCLGALAQQARVIKIPQGDIDLVKLENILSKSMQGSKVRISEIKKSTHLNEFMSFGVSSLYLTAYKVNFKVNDTQPITCSFYIGRKRDPVGIEQCEAYSKKLKISIRLTFDDVIYLPPRPRTYETAQGDIDLDKLGTMLSRDLITTKVFITSVQWSRNPLDYITYIMGTTLEETVAVYQMNLKLNNIHDATCEMHFFLEDRKVRIYRCKSRTAEIEMDFHSTFGRLNLKN